MILAFLQSSKGKLTKGAKSVISAAEKAKGAYGQEGVVGLLIGGDDIQQAAEEASKYSLDKVVICKENDLVYDPAPAIASVIA